jgi:hypothetical protein
MCIIYWYPFFVLFHHSKGAKSIFGNEISEISLSEKIKCFFFTFPTFLTLFLKKSWLFLNISTQPNQRFILFIQLRGPSKLKIFKTHLITRKGAFEFSSQIICTRNTLHPTYPFLQTKILVFLPLLLTKYLFRLTKSLISLLFLIDIHFLFYFIIQKVQKVFSVMKFPKFHLVKNQVRPHRPDPIFRSWVQPFILNSDFFQFLTNLNENFLVCFKG